MLKRLWASSCCRCDLAGTESEATQLFIIIIIINRLCVGIALI